MANQENLYRLLYAVPKTEILKELRLRHDDEQLLELFEPELGAPATLDEILRANHSVLIRLAEDLESFTEEDIRHLHEEFRYRGTKTFYIYSYPPAATDNLDQRLADGEASDFNQALLAAREELEEGAGQSVFSDLQIRSWDRFSVDNEILQELGYSYVAIVRTTDPETEESRFNRDLRFGFVWVNRSTPWLTISAKDEAIAVGLAQGLETFLGTTLNRLPIPKAAELAVESYESVRRASHVDERGIRTRVSHQHLHDFPEEVQELQDRDRSQARVSSGYNATSDGEEFAIGYSREKGAIYFSKLLRTTQLRQFTAHKITSVFRAISDLGEHSPEEVIPFMVDRVMLGSRQTTKAAIREVVSKLASARQSNLDEIELEVNPYYLARKENYFSLTPSIQCIECDDLQDIICSSCGNEHFHLGEENLICTQCDTPLEAGEVRCVLGHEGYAASAREVITLYPTVSLLLVVEQILTQPGLSRYNRYEEGFFIRGTTLHIFGARGDKTIYLIDDIPEFSEPASMLLSDAQEDSIVRLLRDYKEKCREMAVATCSRCVRDRVAPNCFMRLYGLYDHRYTPRPHRGGEFGDVSLNITIDGHEDQSLVILVKKGNPTGHPITMRHGIGRDLYTQLVAFWQDNRVAMIAIAVPQRLEDGFVSHLQRLGRQHQKKLVFFGTEELARIIQFVLDRDTLTLEHL